MKLMSSTTAIRQTLLATAAVTLMAGTAFAGNTLTTAGTPVSNTFTLDYQVGTVTQPTITNETGTADPNDVELPAGPTVFTVDRKVDHIVTATNSTLSTSPGTTATLTFTLRNEGNDNQAYSFSLADLDNAAGTTFDASSLTIAYAVDADDENDIDETFVTIAPTVIGDDPDADPVFVTGDVPKGVRVWITVTGTVAASVGDAVSDDITLVAETRNPTAWAIETIAATDVAEVTTGFVGANAVLGVAQNVMADSTGVAAAETSPSGDGDGLYAVTGIILVASPDIVASKSMTAIKEPAVADPFVALSDCATATAVTNAKAIPGSCIEYVIDIANTGATADAEALNIQDVMPEQVTFVSASIVDVTTTGFVDDPGVADPGGVSGPTLTTPAANTACDGTASTCNIVLNNALLGPGNNSQIVIRALVN
jgi:uncharacterized repeat protein (TIGR01451 family)